MTVMTPSRVTLLVPMARRSTLLFGLARRCAAWPRRRRGSAGSRWPSPSPMAIAERRPRLREQQGDDDGGRRRRSGRRRWCGAAPWPAPLPSRSESPSSMFMLPALYRYVRICVTTLTAAAAKPERQARPAGTPAPCASALSTQMPEPHADPHADGGRQAHAQERHGPGQRLGPRWRRWRNSSGSLTERARTTTLT